MNFKITADLINKQMAAKPFSSNAKAPARLPDMNVDTPIVVTLDQLRSYEHNPRKARNPLYEEIRESIRSRGLDQPPSVTRRPNEEHYIICSGGNTRLEALNELWKETKDERFYRINCLYRPWVSEINSLAGHLAENELHGQMSFIDKARGVAQMKALYEEEHGEALSLRKLAERLKADGVPMAISLLSNMLECVASILPALPVTLMQGLGRPQIAKLIQLKNNLAKVWRKYDETDFFEFWVMVLSGKDNGVDAFSFDVIQDEMLLQMSEMLGQDYSTLELDLAIEAGGTVNTSPIPPEQVSAMVQNPPTLERASPIDEGELQSTAHKTEPELRVTGEKEHDESVHTVNTVGADASATESTIKQGAETSCPQQRQAAENDASTDRGVDKQAFIDAHIVSPSQDSPVVEQVRRQCAEESGENLREFGDAVLESIPVMAGGPSASVQDVWYIENRINDPVGLRRNIWLLVKDICAAIGVNGFTESEDGLGVTSSNLDNDGTPVAIETQRLLEALLCPDQPDETGIQFYRAFSGFLTGHNNAPTIPDTELVKLFRIIRLSRALTAHSHSA